MYKYTRCVKRSLAGVGGRVLLVRSEIKYRVKFRRVRMHFALQWVEFALFLTAGGAGGCGRVTSHRRM